LGDDRAIFRVGVFRSLAFHCEQFKEKLSEIRGWGQADRHFAAHYLIPQLIYDDIAKMFHLTAGNRNHVRFRKYMVLERLNLR
jgi:hypothetical protein